MSLTASERRIWFLHRRDPEDVALTVRATYRLTGALDIARLRAAVGAVAARHEVLRSVHRAGADGEPERTVRADLLPSWEFHDVSGLPEPGRTVRVRVLARRVAARPFDLGDEAPLRCALIRCGAVEYRFVVVAHAIAWDERSWQVLHAELTAAYNGDAMPGERVTEIADRTLPEEAAVEYWRGLLRPPPQPLDIPGRTTLPGPGSGPAGYAARSLPAGLADRLRAFAATHEADPAAVLLAACELVVYRYCAAADFLIAVPVPVRDDAADALGNHDNLLLMRATPAEDGTFTRFAAAVRDSWAAGLRHRRAGIDRVVRELRPDRSDGRDGLEHLVRLGFGVRDDDAGFGFAGVTADRLELGHPAQRIPLQLTMVRRDGEIALEARYRADAFDQRLVDQLLTHCLRLLDGALAEPDRRLGELDMFDRAERADLLARSHGELVAAAPATLVEMFERRAARLPDVTAVIAATGGPEFTEFTYAELARRSNRLAHWLIGQGIGSEDLVGLRMPTGADFVIGVLAVLGAGAAYLPIDPDAPDQQQDFMIAEARPRIVLGPEELLSAERAARGLPESAPTDADRVRPLRPENLAYVIYTSGSSGLPKGVPVAHAAIADHVEGFCAQWGLTAGDRLLQTSPTTFDASLIEMFGPLTVGACLVIPKPRALADIAYVADVIARHRVSVLHMVPSMLRTLLTLPEATRWRSLRQVPVGGEALHGDVADRFAGVFDAELRNHYGPTEAVVSSTHLSVQGPQGTRIVPIGAPNRNVYVYLLDARLRLVPAGVVGEIYLGGAQLARGYLDRPGPAAERFVPDPFRPGQRLYRTGDLARRNLDGELEFLGRVADLAKVRGYRIELGEVQAALVSHPSVRHCLAEVVADPRHGAMLAAYVVPAPDEQIDVAQLRAHASATLPRYMIPSGFAVIDDIPLTAHGKLDRAALPPPRHAPAVRYREPATATESRVAELFGELLGRDAVGGDDSFFELGGHSLLAARLVAALRTEFGVELEAGLLFETATVSGLAALIESAAVHGASLSAGHPMSTG
ncbi:non-ribosomal peptide synthetase [Nocardia wallacei]|uniref:non-ribosomal peptide synthetase n=1 Tax=Nocardia wallacei TaxID=480035 RepID=UPI002453EE92|nr:amino acid adenylation domain-containing protein [Nocardia wallacei]